jgi:hypothetical protein
MSATERPARLAPALARPDMSVVDDAVHRDDDVAEPDVAVRPVRRRHPTGDAGHDDAPYMLERADQVGAHDRRVTRVVLRQRDQHHPVRPGGLAAVQVADPVIIGIIVDPQTSQIFDQRAHRRTFHRQRSDDCRLSHPAGPNGKNRWPSGAHGHFKRHQGGRPPVAR